ncbi:Putative uncharacterized protein [Halomonas sp. R57-5]|nr:Putative uncharacterized protein [Halomonas sp. R57-5]
MGRLSTQSIIFLSLRILENKLKYISLDGKNGYLSLVNNKYDFNIKKIKNKYSICFFLAIKIDSFKAYFFYSFYI